MRRGRKRRIAVTFPDNPTPPPPPEEPRATDSNLRNKMKRLKLLNKKLQKMNEQNSEMFFKKEEVSQKIISTMADHIETVARDAEIEREEARVNEEKIRRGLIMQKRISCHYRKKVETLGEELKKKTPEFHPGCGICLVPFDENVAERVPRVLSECGHTVCHECACRFLRDNIIKCPFDRTETSVPDIRQLKKNHILFTMQL